MKVNTRIQLSLMMFMQFFVWGAWYGQMSKYLTVQLKASGDQVGSSYAVFSIAMIVAPFFVGMLADRFFHAQRVLGVLNKADQLTAEQRHAVGVAKAAETSGQIICDLRAVRLAGTGQQQRRKRLRLGDGRLSDALHAINL